MFFLLVYLLSLLSKGRSAAKKKVRRSSGKGKKKKEKQKKCVKKIDQKKIKMNYKKTLQTKTNNKL